MKNSKIGLHFQRIPSWAQALVSTMPVDFIKIVAPPVENPFPGKQIIGRIYHEEGQDNNLIMRGREGAEEYFRQCVNTYQRCYYIFLWEAVNEPPVGTVEQRSALSAFTLRWIELMHDIGLQTLALSLSVGWPDIGTAWEFADVAIATDYFCYSDDTEIFTENGWLKLKEVVENQQSVQLATLNTNKNCVEFQLPSAFYAHDYEGLLLHQWGSVDFLVTPNHRLWIRRATKAKKVDWDSHRGFEFCEAKDLPCIIEYKRDFPYEGKEKSEFILPAYEKRWKSGRDGQIQRQYIRSAKSFPMDDWLRLMGWWLSEGSLVKTAGKYIGGIQIPQMKNDNRQEIVNLIIRLGYSPKVYGDKAIQIHDVQLGTYFQQFGTSKAKYIPKELKCLSQRQLRILLNTLTKGDGFHEGQRWHYYTSSPSLANDVQEIAMKAGYCVTVSTYREEQYRLTIGDLRHTPETRLKYREWVQYKGKVYCVEVPNGLIYVRRNGQASWQGNSLHEYGAPCMQDGHGYYCLRYRNTAKELAEVGVAMPKTFITEAGIDGGVLPNGKRKGWKTYANGRQDYFDQLLWYERETLKDSYIVAFTPFTSGPYSDWVDFNFDEDLVKMLGQYLETLPDISPFLPIPVPIPIPIPVPIIDTSAIRKACWGRQNVPYNPTAALQQLAAEECLMAPLGPEFDVGEYRVQAYADGIVYCRIGHWNNVKWLNWH